MEEVIATVSPRVTEEMNEVLLQPFSLEEVKCALDQMYPYKSPGPDGMSPVFYQKFWHIIGLDVSGCVLAFLNHDTYTHFNSTHIVLIPKCENPVLVTDFRPISLCNVIYKLASKTIANRIKPLLNDIISESQSAFVPGHHITDNVLVAFELNHFLAHKRWGSVGHIALKLDIIMLEGEPFGFIRPERGLRQGDPLSPYLFIFCAEAFSCMVQQEEREGGIQGVAVCRRAPRVSHLLFADDTLLFCQATGEAMERIKLILEKYEQASGLKINLQKSAVAFSKNTNQNLKESLARQFGVELVDKHEKYLGLPTMCCQSKRELFSNLKCRVWSKMQNWEAKRLSQTGRMVLIKAVAQVIPTYAMGCFLLPDGLLHELESMSANFFWQHDDRQHIHWLSWKKLCKNKDEGGVGFRNLKAFNMAMLAKQAWRLVTVPDSLLSRVMKTKYYPDSDFLAARCGGQPSYAWRSIAASRELIRKGIRW
ncbi:UNVERIFIED_CONTAM: putative mitochondrial protein [Sesamum latifolium]|uniref:Mitochondrial protein n=1 Tax=Sesamum latifolium TaxID=2727402 RepID=A0AAW2VE74_9LAMI